MLIDYASAAFLVDSHGTLRLKVGIGYTHETDWSLMQ